MTHEASFFINVDFDEKNDRQDKVVQDVVNMLDEYVDKNEVRASDLHVALESYRAMLAVNSVVRPTQK